MAKIAYIERKFSKDSLYTIELANRICDDYARRGFSLTLRQLYYQFVARGWIENKQTEYKRLGSIINDARMAGHIDWNHLEDRTRNLQRVSTWSHPSSIISSAAESFRLDPWLRQNYYVEVWVEKDALVGVIGDSANSLRMPYFSCRGYTSQSELWGAAQRLIRAQKINGRKPVIIHLGDHDSSGIDMTRDIQARMNQFIETHGYEPPQVERIALNMDQVEQYNPPPNPAKMTDPRARGYTELYGDESWELDALDPSVLDDLITSTAQSYIDQDEWQTVLDQEEHARQGLFGISRNYDQVIEQFGEL